MKYSVKKMVLLFFLLNMSFSWSQQYQTKQNKDSITSNLLSTHNKKFEELEMLRIYDSLKKEELQKQLNTNQALNPYEKKELEEQIQEIISNEQKRFERKRAKIDSLKKTISGFPVIGPLKDTVFIVYTKSGALKPLERAENISKKILLLYNDDFFIPDSLKQVKSENNIDISYKDNIVLSISEYDALWYNLTQQECAKIAQQKITSSIQNAKNENKTSKILLRIGLVILALLMVYLFFWIVNKAYKWTENYATLKKEILFKNLTHNNYTFLTSDQQLNIVYFSLKFLRWVVYLFLLYITLPILFSIFPFTRGWADSLFSLFWLPFKKILNAVWDFIPNIFSIAVIYIIFKYLIRFVKYIFNEIKTGKLVISGFYSDWAMPTFSVVKFLLYAFMFIMIFPYLPGSDSDIFKGVSVFIGLIFSFGSSTAIANMVAGLVITYMRPFKIGDRIKIGEIVGDVLEKNLLVTRIVTTKKETITIPNSSILTGNTTNYTTEAAKGGIIIHTDLTIGYSVPWKEIHSALIEAALRTEHVLTDPEPFVLQISLDDFYVTYQINAYIKEANLMGVIYSNLHQNIQDVCNEKEIKIVSPHYRS